MNEGIGDVKRKQCSAKPGGEVTHPDIAALVTLLYFAKKGFKNFHFFLTSLQLAVERVGQRSVAGVSKIARQPLHQALPSHHLT